MKYIIHITLLASILVFSSCESFVEPGPPRTEIPLELAFADDKTATASVVGIYARMNNLNYQFANVLSLVLPGMAADELMYAAASPPFDEFRNNTVLSSNQYADLFWSSLYRYIYQANACVEGLERADNLNPQVKSQLIGEAKFIRAFCHFYLVNYYGDVPLILTTDASENNHKPRTPSAEVYAAIIDDLKDARDNLFNSYPSAERADAGGQRIRPNKGVASALLARVYLYTGQFALAEAEATAVISNSLYGLLDKADINDVFHANSAEAIWQLQAINTAGGRNTWEGFLLIPGTPTANPLFRLVPGGLYDAFEEGDLRRANWVGSRTTAADVTYLFPFKYQARFGVIPIEEYTMVFRLAEQYLIRAEARLGQNQPGTALQDINIIRDRAGLNAIPATNDVNVVRQALEQERRIELFAEWGHRWFDLRRWPSVTGDPGKTRADDILAPVKPAWQSKAIYLPIPDEAIRTNPNLTPN